MKYSQLFVAAVVAVLASSPAFASSETTGWQYPVIKNYGKVKPVPEADMAPSSDRQRRVLMDIKKGAENADEPGSGLVHVARLVNLHALAGLPPDSLDVVAVIHGKATRGVLSDKQYRAEFGGSNPNTGLIQALTQAGVKLVVCGQALAHRGFSPESVNSNVSLALSAMTALEQFQHDGYVLLP